MSQTIDPRAGQLADPAQLLDVPRLIAAYYATKPDPAVPEQRVAFGTSGHRGSSLAGSFNEDHILAIATAICEYRQAQAITGPLFMGFDTHALSWPAFTSALEVFAAQGVQLLIAEGDEYTPTPAISHAIIRYNRARPAGGLADGIVITPSHNPPDSGGFKYNPPNGGPADTKVTAWIEARANAILGQAGAIRRLTYAKALAAPTTARFNFIDNYVGDLAQVVDLPAIAAAKLHFTVDALGGAGLHYWQRIADEFRLDLTILDAVADPTFRFMHYDWDGKIRMDPSSAYAMRGLTALKDKYDLAFACDTDHDRHGIVTKAGLMQANQFLAISADYLLANRPDWPQAAGIGKTVVSSGVIDRIARRHGRTLFEPPVGFKWFVDGLQSGALGFVGEESAGSTFLRHNGQVWTTDKDGMIAGLLAAEMTARLGHDPAELYAALPADIGASAYRRSDTAAQAAIKKALSGINEDAVTLRELAGDPVARILTKAPGNGAAIGGVKVETKNGWFAARPSGTEDIIKIYAESFEGEEHLRRIEDEATAFVSRLV